MLYYVACSVCYVCLSCLLWHVHIYSQTISVVCCVYVYVYVYVYVLLYVYVHVCMSSACICLSVSIYQYIYIYWKSRMAHMKPLDPKPYQILGSLMSALFFLNFFVKNYTIVYGMIVYYLQVFVCIYVYLYTALLPFRTSLVCVCMFMFVCVCVLKCVYVASVCAYTSIPSLPHAPICTCTFLSLSYILIFLIPIFLQSFIPALSHARVTYNTFMYVCATTLIYRALSHLQVSSRIYLRKRNAFMQTNKTNKNTFTSIVHNKYVFFSCCM